MPWLPWECQGPRVIIQGSVSQGSIPDMTSTTAMYLDLQRIFRDRAEADVAALAERVRQIEALLGRAAPKVSLSTIRSFAKNARNIRWDPHSLPCCPVCH